MFECTVLSSAVLIRFDLDSLDHRYPTHRLQLTQFGHRFPKLGITTKSREGKVRVAVVGEQVW